MAIASASQFQDVNNWWIVKRPNVDNLGVNETRDVIRDKEEIHLVHGMTGRLLNSHDVSAPVSPQHQVRQRGMNFLFEVINLLNSKNIFLGSELLY